MCPWAIDAPAHKQINRVKQVWKLLWRMGYHIKSSYQTSTHSHERLLIKAWGKCSYIRSAKQEVGVRVVRNSLRTYSTSYQITYQDSSHSHLRFLRKAFWKFSGRTYMRKTICSPTSRWRAKQFLIFFSNYRWKLSIKGKSIFIQNLLSHISLNTFWNVVNL